MTTKSERIRERMSSLQAQLDEAQKEERQRAKQRAARALKRASHRSGLDALLLSRNAIATQALEDEFREITIRLSSTSALAETPGKAIVNHQEGTFSPKEATDGTHEEGEQ
jgi:hypothetical protein